MDKHWLRHAGSACPGTIEFPDVERGHHRRKIGIAESIHVETASRVAGLAAQGVRPKLVFVRVGEDPASKVYVGMKEKTSVRLGLISETFVLPETATEEELLTLLGRLNADAAVHGILVQAPLRRRSTRRAQAAGGSGEGCGSAFSRHQRWQTHFGRRQRVQALHARRSA